MTAPRVLLLTSHTPGSKPGIGGLFLGDLCLAYPRDSICCFSITLPKFQHVSPELEWLPIEYGDIPRQTGIRRLGTAVNRATGLPMRQIGRMWDTSRLVDRAVNFGRQHQTEIVWAVPCHPTVIHMAQRVAERLDARLELMLWDPPELMAEGLDYDPLSAQATLRVFGRLLQAADRCVVASAGMKDEYEARFNIKSEVMIYSLNPSLRKPPSRGLKAEGTFTIGFAGSLYAIQEWEALLRALSSVDWRMGGREVVIRFMGSNVALRAKSRANIEFLGWRPTGETIEILSGCDIAYLPYWFDAAHRVAVRLCFPNKFPSYLMAGIPVFFHGPEDSSPAEFLKHFPAGVCCPSLQPEAIVEKLTPFVSDPQAYKAASDATQLALDKGLNWELFYQHFAWLLGVSLEDLNVPVYSRVS